MKFVVKNNYSLNFVRVVIMINEVKRLSYEVCMWMVGDSVFIGKK